MTTPRGLRRYEPYYYNARGDRFLADAVEKESGDYCLAADVEAWLEGAVDNVEKWSYWDDGKLVVPTAPLLALLQAAMGME